MTHPEDTATIDRDLEAVESALLSGRAGHDEPAARELQELALTLAADVPQPSEEFAGRMRERVATEFPRARRERRSLSSLMRDFAPAAGLAATILLVVGVVVVAGGGGSGSDDAASGGASSGGGAAESAAGGGASEPRNSGSADGASGDQAAGPAVDPAGPNAPDQFTPQKGFAPGQPNRRIERNFSMELSVPVKEM